MRTRIGIFTSSLAAALFLLPAIAQAEEEHRKGEHDHLTEGTLEPAALAPAPGPEEDTGMKDEAAAEEEEGGVGINFDVEMASAYVWRGLNVFQSEGQLDQRGSVFPSVTAAVGPVSFGYWGAWQATGDNAGDNLDGALSGETDLWAQYDGSITDELGYSGSLWLYTYPFATDFASYIEPGAGLSYATAVDLGFNVSYMYGMQEAARPFSYVFLGPSVGKDISLTDSLDLNLGVAGGYKIWTHREDLDGDGSNDSPDGNEVHMQVDAGVTVPFGNAYVSPAAHFSWTNLPAPLSFGDEYVVWAGLHIGYDLSI
jgi:hypothetical protein